jgi:YggT family protein
LSVISLILLIINLYIIVIIISALLSWLQPTPGEALYNVKLFLDKLSSVVVNPIRRLLPVFRVGSMGFDLSPLIAIILLELLGQVIVRIAS